MKIENGEVVADVRIADFKLNMSKEELLNLIGIGSTLTNVKQKIGNYIEVGDTYELEKEKGICFELEDVEDWEELMAPIEFIYVLRV